MEYGSIALTGWLLIGIMLLIENYYPRQVQDLLFDRLWNTIVNIVLVISSLASFIWIWS